MTAFHLRLRAEGRLLSLIGESAELTTRLQVLAGASLGNGVQSRTEQMEARRTLTEILLSLYLAANPEERGWGSEVVGRVQDRLSNGIREIQR